MHQICGLSSVGRVLLLQRRCHRFEPCSPYQKNLWGCSLIGKTTALQVVIVGSKPIFSTGGTFVPSADKYQWKEQIKMPRKEKQFHYIYKTTNLITNKFYVGMHSTNNLQDGYIGSGKILKYSIAKYGKENHKFEILEFVDSRKELAARESIVVNEALLSDPLNMNLKIGGFGGFGYINSRRDFAAHNKKLAEKRNYKDPSFLKKLSESLKKSYKDNPSRPKGVWTKFDGMAGKKHSEESKAKMSIAQTGEKNSQHGTMWVSDLASKKSFRVDKDFKLSENIVKGKNVWLIEERAKEQEKISAATAVQKKQERLEMLRQTFEVFSKTGSIGKTAVELNMSYNGVKIRLKEYEQIRM